MDDDPQFLPVHAERTLEVTDYVAGHLPPLPGSIGTMTGRQYLDWVTDRCVEWYDEGRIKEALMLYMHLVSQHPGTARILEYPDRDLILRLAVQGGREQFDLCLRGFSV